MANQHYDVILLFARPWPGKTMSGRQPYPLLLIQHYLRKRGLSIKIVDQRTVGDFDLFCSSLDSPPICFGISSFTGVQISNSLDMAGTVRAHFPQTPIVWGGWHPSGSPEQTLQHPMVDFVVKGQGEETLEHLIMAIDGDRDFGSIPGIFWQDKGQLFSTPPAELKPFIEDFRTDFDSVDFEKYIFPKKVADHSSNSAGILTSLGCPHHCAFCEVASIYKRKVFFRKTENIMFEVDTLVERFGATGITVDDDNFFASPSRVRQFCEALISRKYRISWDAGVSVDLFLKNYDDDFLQLLRESGCSQLYIGAESGSNEVLKAINKKATVEHTYEFVKRMTASGIRPSFSSMVGFPGVPNDEVYSTLDMILKCRDISTEFDFRLFFYTPYPGTPMYDDALKAGFTPPDSLEGWAQHTLRRFRAPWVKGSIRRLVKYFCFYLYPFTDQSLRAKQPKSMTDRILRIIFENALMKKIAAWRISRRNFKWLIDGAYAVTGARIRSALGRILKGNYDPFYELDH